MTMQSQRKSCHWFLLLVKQKRVEIDDVNIPDEDNTKKDISKLPCATWIPTIDSFQSLLESFAFQIAHPHHIKDCLAFVSSERTISKASSTQAHGTNETENTISEL